MYIRRTNLPLAVPLWRVRRRWAFTTMEMIIVMLILAIMSSIAMDFVAESESYFRSDRAARETVIALRFARTLATTTGNSSGVEFDTAQKKIKVYTVISGAQTWVNSALYSGNAYQIDLANAREVQGVSMTPSIPSDATNPYDVVFDPLGATKNTGTISFSYGHNTRTVTVASLADPTIN